MTQQIYDTKQFPFANIHLGKPYNLNGMYFIKMFVKDSPIYVQPPKCFIKQGILKSGKKWFCDLVFSIEDGYFLTWLEQIEEIAKQKIFENRANWFETELDEHDIENSLVSPYKMFRSGKMFIIRANLPTTLDKCDLKIYDETENEIQPENVTDDTNVITILELKGIKCSARNFQFVFDVRQMLVVSPVKIFEKCIIKKTGPERGRDILSENEVEPVRSLERGINEGVLAQSMNITTTPTNPSIPASREVGIREQPNENMNRQLHTEPSFFSDDKPTERVAKSTQKETQSASLSTFDGLPSKVNDPTPEMYEFEIDLADLEKNDAVQIKPRNDVYYKLYKEAKQKAKEAKLLALSNYLEAKRLKTTYLLEDSSDSSDDEDNDDDEDMNDNVL